MRDGEQASKGSFNAFLSINYGYRPFELGNIQTTRRVGAIIDHLVGFDLGVTYAPLDWLEVGLNLPFLQATVGNRDLAAAIGGSGASVGLGDLAVSVGFAPLRQDQNSTVSLSIVPRFVLPTGSRGVFLGAGSAGIGLDVALARRWRHFRFGAALGYQYNTSSSATFNIYADDELRWGLGLGVPFEDGTWEIGLEWSGGTVLVAEGREVLGEDYAWGVHTPTEMLLAGMYTPDRPYWVRFGMGPGLSKGWGTPDLRAFAQVGYGKRTKPVYDTDGDGIVDDDDACPTSPEDLDRFEDDDGCPTTSTTTTTGSPTPRMHPVIRRVPWCSSTASKASAAA